MKKLVDNGQNLSCVALPSSTNIFTLERVEFSFAVAVKVDLTLHLVVCRSFGFNAGRGHKS